MNCALVNLVTASCRIEQKRGDSIGSTVSPNRFFRTEPSRCGCDRVASP
jgi:hypothetical protein